LAGAAVAVAQVDAGLHLNPELALALFIAPVLLDAAYDTSLRDLKRHWGPVASLVVIAVGLTTFAVALVVHALVPRIPWAAAIAIGAIVAPPYFPERSMLLFAAFTVTLGTLLIQGLTLRPLALALCLRDDEDTVARGSAPHGSRLLRRRSLPSLTRSLRRLFPSELTRLQSINRAIAGSLAHWWIEHESTPRLATAFSVERPQRAYDTLRQ
jgi:NhaP-type Na+/H+ or K+/H+ antiporter